MAQMVPPQCSNAIPGEVEIFKRLAKDPLANDWIVLHSVKLANHNKQLEGEIDFVVIIPWRGVLCLEVKSHLSITRDVSGLWHMGHDKPEIRGPFKQASEAMQSLRSYLVSKDPSLSRVPFYSCVIMPFASFTLPSPEWHPWQLVDTAKFNTRSFANILWDIMTNARELMAESPSCFWFEPSQRQPNPGQCEKLRALIRGPGGEKPHLARLARNEAAAFTSEQFYALDAMVSNKRVLFQGPAGTGKTTLACESARRSAAAGHSVLLVCFNQHLAEELKEELSDLTSVTVSTLHALMFSIAKLCPPADPEDIFWQEELPAAACAQLSRLIESGDVGHVYDLLLVDEAQDIFLPDYLEFLTICLKGGLTTGVWRIFGDFDHQAIYADEFHISREQFMEGRGGSTAEFSLTVNCRNTSSIVDLLKMVAAPNPPYSRVLRRENHDLVYLDYATEEEQRQRLVDSLTKAWNAGLRGRDIVVLSPKAEGCASHALPAPWSERLQPMGRTTGDQIPWCSIHAFKGLEAPWVIVTDLEDITTPQAKCLIYVALTRSLGNLTLLMSKNIKERLVEIVIEWARKH